MSETLEKIIDAVKAAGKIYKGAKGHIQAQEKGSNVNLVTQFDKDIQDFLFVKMSEIIPDCSFLGEEEEGNKELKDGYCFIIDPIDGTTNFIKGFKHSAISVGLAFNKELIMGVVYDPDKDDIYYAERGCGAFLNGEKIEVSKEPLESSLVLFGTCPYEHELAHKTFAFTEEIFYKCLEVRRTGSAALDICYVASGKADLYYELILRPWDYAGASVILREAGGVCRTVNDGEIDCSKIQSYTCGNKTNMKEFLELANGLL